MNNILVTGAAGFVGYHLAYRLLSDGLMVAGADNLNNYYDVALKESRLSRLMQNPRFAFSKMDLSDRAAAADLFNQANPDIVVHLAVQAGVRHSLVDPHAYVQSNLLAFLNVLEGCRGHRVKHLVFASSSSVYGANTRMPFSVHHNVDHPVSFYAATKKAGELMAHSYSALYGLPRTSLLHGLWAMGVTLTWQCSSLRGQFSRADR